MIGELGLDEEGGKNSPESTERCAWKTTQKNLKVEDSDSEASSKVVAWGESPGLRVEEVNQFKTLRV